MGLHGWPKWRFLVARLTSSVRDGTRLPRRWYLQPLTRSSRANPTLGRLVSNCKKNKSNVEDERRRERLSRALAAAEVGGIKRSLYSVCPPCSCDHSCVSRTCPRPDSYRRGTATSHGQPYGPNQAAKIPKACPVLSTLKQQAIPSSPPRLPLLWSFASNELPCPAYPFQPYGTPAATEDADMRDGHRLFQRLCVSPSQATPASSPDLGCPWTPSRALNPQASRPILWRGTLAGHREPCRGARDEAARHSQMHCHLLIASLLNPLGGSDPATPALCPQCPQ